jgi:hypothetical protein
LNDNDLLHTMMAQYYLEVQATPGDSKRMRLHLSNMKAELPAAFLQ